MGDKNIHSEEVKVADIEYFKDVLYRQKGINIMNQCYQLQKFNEKQQVKDLINPFIEELKMNKNECMKRVLKRDLIERGKFKKQAKKDFFKSWDIYYEKFNNKTKKKFIGTEFVITKNTNIDHLIKKIK